MKTMTKQMKTLAAVLMAGAALTACSSDDVMETTKAPAAGTYTMTVVASKGGDDTMRALTDANDGTLTATWATTEKVYVMKGTTLAGGSLQPQTAAASATLKGTLTGVTIAANDELTLQFPKSGDITYSGQKGTLADIAANFDYATATVKVASVDASGAITPESDVKFKAQQAIVKFTLTDNAETPAAIKPTALTINDGTNDIVKLESIPTATYTTNGDGVLYVALPAVSSKPITLTATVGTDTYCVTTSAAKTFENGKFYRVTAKMYRTIASATSSDYGMVVCAAGHLHKAKTAVPTGCTAVGILGKVTTTGHGLILALQDAAQKNWNDINGWTSVTTYAGTTLKVLPDNGARTHRLKSYTTLGSTTVSNWAVAQKSDYVAIFTNLGSTTGDSNGKIYDGNVNAYITTGVGGTAISGSYCSATEYDGASAWHISNSSWADGGKSNERNVRPVLGF